MTARLAHTLSPVLVFRAHSNLCAVPLSCVLETMRPLPTEAFKDMPGFVRGLSIIRGSPFPVVDVGALLGTNGQMPVTRFIALRISETRGIALAVEEVVGVKELDPSLLQRMPSLLHGADSERVAAIGTLDGELLVILQEGKMLSEDVWQFFGMGGSAL